MDTIHTDTINLFYFDAPLRLEDKLYTKWLCLVRKKCAEAFQQTFLRERLLADPKKTDFCNLCRETGMALEVQNEISRAFIIRSDHMVKKIIQNPSNEKNKALMQQTIDQCIY